MIADERSERALKLTNEALEMNPGHYSVWQYRRRILESGSLLGQDYKDEYDWLNRLTEENQKNYQVWYHRQWLSEKLDFKENESSRLSLLLEEEPKNYHLWAYRLNLLKF